MASQPQPAQHRDFAYHREDGLRCLRWHEAAGDTQEWDDLALRAAEPNPFFESWHLIPSLKWLDRMGEGEILTIRRGGELCGLMPIARRTNYHGRPLTHISTWRHPNMFFATPLVARGAEDYFWRELLEWADANPGMAIFLHLDEIALEGPVHRAMRSVLGEEGRAWGVVDRKERALLAPALEPDDYLARALSPRKRKDLGRRFRRLSELGEAEFRWQTDAEGIKKWTEEFLSLEAAGWKGERRSALACDRATDRLFRDCLAGAARQGRLARLALRLDDKPIAMLSTFVTPPGSFGFKTAFDEQFARYSPGFLIEREFVNSWPRLGAEWCDSCAAPDHSVMNRVWRERRPIGSVSIAIGGAIRRAAFQQILRREQAAMQSRMQS